MGLTVHIHGRSEEKLDGGRGRRSSPRPATSASTPTSPTSPALAEVQALADEIAALDALHLLVNNAGMGSGFPDSRERQESADGIELRFAVNYLAGFVLTERLLPLLQRSAPARIVMVASRGQAAIDFDDPMLASTFYEGRRAYAQSKLAQITYAVDLAERLGPDSGRHDQRPPPLHLHADQDRARAARRIDRHPRARPRGDPAPRLRPRARRGQRPLLRPRGRGPAPTTPAYDPEAQRQLRELSERLAGDFLQ